MVIIITTIHLLKYKTQSLTKQGTTQNLLSRQAEMVSQSLLVHTHRCRLLLVQHICGLGQERDHLSLTRSAGKWPFPRDHDTDFVI